MHKVQLLCSTLNNYRLKVSHVKEDEEFVHIYFREVMPIIRALNRISNSTGTLNNFFVDGTVSVSVYYEQGEDVCLQMCVPLNRTASFQQHVQNFFKPKKSE